VFEQIDKEYDGIKLQKTVIDLLKPIRDWPKGGK
jgi:hypothetical protein